MSKNRVIKKASLYGLFWRFMPTGGALNKYVILANNSDKLLNSVRLVPRAGLEPARPLFTKPRILSPVHKKDKSLDQKDNSKKSQNQNHQKGITLFRIVGAFVASLEKFIGGKNGKIKH